MSPETQARTGTHVETELKLRFPDRSRIAAFMQAIGRRAALTAPVMQRHEDTYLDTPRGDLRRAGLGARVRRSAQGASIVIKPVLLAPTPLLVRTELGRSLGQDEDAGAALRELVETTLGLRLDAVPQAVVILRAERRQAVLTHGKFEAELCEDRVEATPAGGGPTTRLSEVELELVRGSAAAMLALVDAVRADVECVLSTDGKLVRALRRLGLPGFDCEPPAPELSGRAPASLMVQRQLAHQVARIRAYAPGTAAGLDTKQLHRMRVAIRRLRSGLQVFRADLDRAEAKALGRRLKALGRVLGEQRDLDVHIENARRDRDLFGGDSTDALLTRLSQRRESVLADTREVIHSPEFESLLALAERVVSPRASTPERTASACAAQILRREAKRFSRRVKALAARPDGSHLHEIRIAGKRLRYAVEFLAPILPSSAGPLIDRLKSAQDELGAFQDDTALLAREDLAWGQEPAATARAQIAARVAYPAEFLSGVLQHLDVRSLGKALKRLSREMDAPATGPA